MSRFKNFGKSVWRTKTSISEHWRKKNDWSSRFNYRWPQRVGLPPQRDKAALARSRLKTQFSKSVEGYLWWPLQRYHLKTNLKRSLRARRTKCWTRARATGCRHTTKWRSTSCSTLKQFHRQSSSQSTWISGERKRPLSLNRRYLNLKLCLDHTMIETSSINVN